MAIRLSRKPVTNGVKPERTDKEVQDEIDRWLIAGCLLSGTMLLAVLGVPMLVKSYRLTRQARADGRALRPNIITIVGVVCLVDAFVNWLIWGVDLFPTHDTLIGRTMFNGFGRLWDGAYYLGYNRTAAGGSAISAEKSWEFASVFMMYPMRIVAGWGFLKMKRWGFQFFLVSAWLYVMFWFGYPYQFTQQFAWRFTHTAWGVTGWWIVDVLYFTPFLMIPFLHTVNRELWSD